ncbi:polymer-forming cytoskeletal protein [Niallia oryzisoli]|uniref:polymer-forming cytoskeletal protein n=1 Tax=Niallia oryzisoli TaxID=1737571 RepID=UPI0037367917
MKLKALIVPTLLVGILAACGADEEAEEPKKEAETEQTAGQSTVAQPEEKTDAVATASITDDPAVFAKALSEEGNWIVAATKDLTLDEELVVNGEFHDKGEAANPIYRKLALYTQDEQRNVTGTFTLTVPKIIVQSENFTIVNGTVKGDVIVEAKGFTLKENTTIDGNLFFANEEAKETAVVEGTVTGVGPESGVEDVVSSASIVYDEDALIKAASKEGNWIFTILGDLTLDKELVVAGEFYNKNDKAQGIYRKLGLYSQDGERNVKAAYTLTVPKLTVQSENFKIQNGTVKGDVYVETNGFTLAKDTTIDGNVYFASEEFQKSAVIEGTITGAQEVK